jgi:hypothetical protein
VSAREKKEEEKEGRKEGRKEGDSLAGAGYASMKRTIGQGRAKQNGRPGKEKERERERESDRVSGLPLPPFIPRTFQAAFPA